jgi:DNA polymerase-3 subunit delta
LAEPAENSLPALGAVYLFNGDDELKRNTLLKRLADRVAATGDLMMNMATLSADTIKDPDLLLDALTTLPFAGQYRLVVLEKADKMSKEASDVLVDYLKNPVETTVLAVLADGLKSSTKLYKAIRTYDQRSIIDTSSIKTSELPNWLKNLANDYRMSLDYQAAEALVSRVGTSNLALNNELKRLAAWAQANDKHHLTVIDIIEQVPALVEPKGWELADALCERNASAVLKIYSEMYSTSATSIFLQCITRLREVLTIIALKQRGMVSTRQIAEELRRPEWQLRSQMAASNRFFESELREIIKTAAATERALKSGQDPDHVLTLWLLKVCNRAV